MKSIALQIQEFAKTTPEQIALIINDEKCDYKTLAEYNRKAAKFLAANGIKAGDRIVVEADHIMSYVYFWYGIQLLGATFVPVEKSSPSKRIIEIAEELDAVKMVSLEKRDDLADAWSLAEIKTKISRKLKQLTMIMLQQSLMRILFLKSFSLQAQPVNQRVLWFPSEIR